MDISTRGFDGQSGGVIGGGQDRVAVQPDFANMTLEQIQAYEAAHNANPLTGAVPASAVIEPHVSGPETPLQYDETGAQVTGLSLVPALPEENQTDTETLEFVKAQFSLGEPFIHVVAILTQGPLEIVATPAEALELWTKLGEALGAAQRAGVLQ